MKFNFKKIASVLAGTVMLSSTLAFAAAANYPAPFVQGGNANVAIVVGSAAQVTDYAAVFDINSDLSDELVKQTAPTTTTSSGASATGGDSVKIEKSADKLNLGNGLLSVWGTALQASDLKRVLADGKFFNKQNTEYKYNQKIDLGNLTFSHFSDSDYENRLPTLGFQLNANTFVANYTLDFITDPEATHGTDLTDFENKNIDILGKNYYILDFKNSTAKITLLDSATTVNVASGETKTVTLGDKTYSVTPNYIGSDEVVLTVDDVNTDKLSATGTTYGNTYKLADGTYVGVKSINYQAFASGTQNVEFSIGKGKLELTDGSNVKINDKTVNNLWSYVTLSASSNKRTWQKLVLKWQIEDEAYLTPSKELLMPGFEAVKLSVGNTTIPAKEKVKVSASNDVLELRAPIKKGEVTIPLLYISTTTGNITGIGKSATQRLATSNTTELIYNSTSSSVSQYEGFVASWASSREAESHYLKASVRYDSDGVRNLTTITDKTTNTILCEDLPATQTCTIGNVVLTVNNVGYTSGGDRITNMTINSGGSFNTLYTDKRLKVTLPWSTTYNVTNQGAINLQTIDANANDGYHVGKWILWVSEADKDGTLAQKDFNATIDDAGSSTKYISVTAVDGDGTAAETPSSGSKMWESYVVSDLATKVLHDQSNSNQYSAELEYHGEQVYANVFVSDPTTVITSTDSSGTTGTTKVLGSVRVSDDEATAITDKNLIVVGGSCVNKVAAELLGLTYPACGSAWETKTGTASGSFLIQTFSRTGGKVATLVAGYNAGDTTNAAKALTTQSVDTSVAKRYDGNVATAITLATTTTTATPAAATNATA